MASTRSPVARASSATDKAAEQSYDHSSNTPAPDGPIQSRGHSTQSPGPCHVHEAGHAWAFWCWGLGAGGTLNCRHDAMIGLVRLICERRDGEPDGPERKVFDVPRPEASNLRRRLERAGWLVTETPI